MRNGIVYSITELRNNINDIKNDIVRETLKHSNLKILSISINSICQPWTRLLKCIYSGVTKAIYYLKVLKKQ